MALLPVADALDRILRGAAPLGSEPVPLATARGRVLADDLTATLTQPPFDASAMDGYAVRATDVATLPARLVVTGESAAGRGFNGILGTGEAVRIFTGAPVPDGADAIVIQENAVREGDRLTVHDGIPEAAHIRPRGGDFAAGQVLLGAGTRLDARALTLAAAMGHGVVPVYRKPVVAILATGDELVLPGTPPGPDQIVCSNPWGIAAMVEAAGGIARFAGIAPDDATAVRRMIGAAASGTEAADVVITIGGASVGDHDHVAGAIESLGGGLDFWKIAMRPGKPLMSGTVGVARLVGLPGNPVSSLICTRVFVVPLVRRLAGLGDDAQERRRAVLAAPLEANGPRTHYMRARLLSPRDPLPRVTPMPNQDSSLLSPLALADCLIVRPPDAPAVPPGAEIEILLLDF